MKRVIYFKVAGKDVHLPKLIGAFILFAALLMFIRSSAVMFDSWDNLKYLDTCLKAADPGSFADFSECRDALYNTTGLWLREGQGKLTTRQFWGALLHPIASLLFWLAILFVGWICYRTGELVLPIEERIREFNDAPKPKKNEEKKKK